MGKTKLSSLFRGGAGRLLTAPLCSNAKTLSFRVEDDMIKTVNSVLFDDILEAATPESWFTNSSETASHSTESDQDLDAESLETVVRGVVRSERLFFDPGATSSIVEETNEKSIEEISVSVAMESEDPYGDFRRSMEEMVRSHGELAKDWRSLESMLEWYLRMNERRSRDVIISAFVDLVSGLSDSVSDSGRYSTAVSSLPSSPLCSLSSKADKTDVFGGTQGIKLVHEATLYSFFVREETYDDLRPKKRFCMNRRRHSRKTKKRSSERKEIQLMAPSFTREQVKVTFVHASKMLRVTGERPLGYRKWSCFNEMFTVPRNCLVDKIHGSFSFNTLTITMPKETITKMPNLPETPKTVAERVEKLEEKRLLEVARKKEEEAEKIKKLLEEKEGIIRKLQEEAKAKEMAEAKRLQEEAKAKEMAEAKRLQEEAKAKEMAEAKKLQEEARAKEMAEAKKLQEEAKAKEMAEAKKLQEEAKAKEMAEAKKLEEEAKAKGKLVEEATPEKSTQEKKPVDSTKSVCSLAKAGAIFSVKAASLAVMPVLRVSHSDSTHTYMATKGSHQVNENRIQRSIQYDKYLLVTMGLVLDDHRTAIKLP
ncbi:hypothetical protein HID58_044879 [Brassica napus]|uniref:Transcription repressor n=1 Tax=Brassica napus TaxID=3708 RepID=A0ABQ8ATD1_BRANA|nr:hypothetical protein HID58_044879 [Brassica napus]